MIKDRGVRVVSHDFKRSIGSTFVKIEIPSIDPEVVEEESKYPLIYIDTYFQEEQKGEV